MRKYMLERYYKQRAAAIEQLGSKCAICASTEGLEFDHKNAATKSFGISQRWSGRVLPVELEKCQLLCAKCHKEKSSVDISLSKRGTRNPNSKLTADQVKEIRARYGELRQHELAKIYGVSRQTIGGIVSGKSYTDT